MNSASDLQWYSRWMGFGDRNYIPPEYDFKKFCAKRDIWMYASHNYNILQRINSDREIYVFRDDNLQCLKLTESNESYHINIKSKDRLDLDRFDQGKALAMAMLTEKSDIFCEILEKFYKNLNGNPIKYSTNKGTNKNIEVISGIRGFSMVADLKYQSQAPFSIDVDIRMKDNEQAFFATEALYNDLNDVKIKSENIETRLQFLKLKAK